MLSRTLIRKTNSSPSAPPTARTSPPKDRIRLHGALHDVITNQFHGAQPGENLWYELAIREVLTGKHQTIDYVSGTIFDVVTDIREES